jgi:hypothetical protein
MGDRRGENAGDGRVVEDIKEGFGVINRNLPLVLIQTGTMLLSLLLFIILVGIPIAIAIIYFGIDIGRFKGAVETIKDPIDFLYEYSGLAIFMVTSFVLYLTVITGIALFVFGGNMAIMKGSIIDQTEKFSFKKFIKEGKRYFQPLCWLTLILGIFFLIFIFLIGAIVGTAIILLAPYREEIGTFIIIVAIISGMILLLLAFIGFLMLLTVSMYAVIALIVDELRAWNAIKTALTFMKKNLFEAVGFYILLIAGYFGAIILMMIVAFPFNMIPFIGPIISIPFQFVTYIIQVYLGLVMMASLMVFYTKRSVKT